MNWNRQNVTLYVYQIIVINEYEQFQVCWSTIYPCLFRIGKVFCDETIACYRL